jgi:hypothetical protein
LVQEWIKIQSQIKDLVDYNLPDLEQRKLEQSFLWNWISGEPLPEVQKQKVLIQKVSSHKRGRGSMTAAIYFDPKINNFNYVEVIYKTSSDYQRNACSLSKEDANSLIGKTIREINENERFEINRSHFHASKFNESGDIISLIC